MPLQSFIKPKTHKHDYDKLFETLGTEIIRIDIDKSLLEIADPLKEGRLEQRINQLRLRLTKELGYIIPDVVVKETKLGENEFSVSIREVEVIRQTVISSDSPEEVISAHLENSVIEYVDEILSINDIQQYKEFVKSQNPQIVETLVPQIIADADLRTVFANLIRERVPVKDTVFIFERLCDYARYTKETDDLTERLRCSLGRQICSTYTTKDRTLQAITFSDGWMQTFNNSCQRTGTLTMCRLSKAKFEELINAIVNALMNTQQRIGKLPVLLCEPNIRLLLYRMLTRHISQLVMISFNEIPPNVNIEIAGLVHEIHPNNNINAGGE